MESLSCKFKLIDFKEMDKAAKYFLNWQINFGIVYSLLIQNVYSNDQLTLKYVCHHSYAYHTNFSQDKLYCLKIIEDNPTIYNNIKNCLWILALLVRYQILSWAFIQAYKTISACDDKNWQFTMHMMREYAGIDSI